MKPHKKQKEIRLLEFGRKDVVKLLEFSLHYPFDNAVASFPMFSKQQLREVSALSRSTREKLLAERLATQELPPEHRVLAQKEKLRDIAMDPSNR